MPQHRWSVDGLCTAHVLLDYVRINFLAVRLYSVAQSQNLVLVMPCCRTKSLKCQALTGRSGGRTPDLGGADWHMTRFDRKQNSTFPSSSISSCLHCTHSMQSYLVFRLSSTRLQVLSLLHPINQSEHSLVTIGAYITTGQPTSQKKAEKGIHLEAREVPDL